MEILKKIVFNLAENSLLRITCGLFLCYLIYYLTAVVQRPKIYSNKRMKQFLFHHCPVVGEKFWPAFWCIEYKAQTILTSLLKSSPDIPFEREVVITPDGGCIALDWVAAPLRGGYTEINQPTVILLPGITGSSKEGYVRHLTRQALNLGLRVVVFMQRGLGGVPLLTAKTYNARGCHDVELVVSHVASKYPDAPIFGTGVSFGGILLINYLAEKGRDSRMFGAMTVSNPFEVHGCNESLEKPINKFMFNRYVTFHLSSNIYKHKELFEEEYDIDHIMKTRTLREYDNAVTAKMFGYEDWDEYYRDVSVHEKLRHITVPLLCLNAADDPFSPGSLLPKEQATNSENVALVETKYGGHIGFLDSIIRPWDENYMDRFYYQWLYAILYHRDELMKNTD